MGGRGASGIRARELTLQEKIAQARREAQEYRSAQQSSNRSQTVQRDTERQGNIVDYVSRQVSVDLDKYRDETSRRFDPKDGINVDWKRMPETVKNKLRNLSTQKKGTHRITLEDNGAWMKLIRLKRI